MTSTVQELIDNLNKLEDKSMLIFVVHGASDAVDAIGTPFTRTVFGDESGPIENLPVGTKYASLYIGN